MNIITSQLTIVFEPPFYKAIFERKSANQYEVAQVTLGTSEPKTPAIIQLVMKNWRNIHFLGRTAILPGLRLSNTSTLSDSND